MSEGKIKGRRRATGIDDIKEVTVYEGVKRGRIEQHGGACSDHRLGPVAQRKTMSEWISEERNNRTKGQSSKNILDRLQYTSTI